MQKIEAKKIVRQYARELQIAQYPFSAIYLFGSQAKGKANRWSDIDVAVVSNKLRKNKNRIFLWRLRRKVDTRIEPHGFTIKDFQDNSNPLVYEVKKTGVKIA